MIASSVVPPPHPHPDYLLFRRSGEDLEPTPEADDLNVTDESHLWSML
jgi:hypothetical protein